MAALLRADPALAVAWWVVLAGRGVPPAVFAVATGALVGAVQAGGDLTAARDVDLGMTGPPLSIAMDYIAAGLVELVGGVAAAVVLAGFAWWAPLLLGGAWPATHWLLRESSVWKDRATRLRARPRAWSVTLVVAANLVVFCPPAMPTAGIR